MRVGIDQARRQGRFPTFLRQPLFPSNEPPSQSCFATASYPGEFPYPSDFRTGSAGTLPPRVVQSARPRRAGVLDPVPAECVADLRWSVPRGIHGAGLSQSARRRRFPPHLAFGRTAHEAPIDSVVHEAIAFLRFLFLALPTPSLLATVVQAPHANPTLKNRLSILRQLLPSSG